MRLECTRTQFVLCFATLALALMLVPVTAGAIVIGPDTYEPDDATATASVIPVDGVWQNRTVYPDGDVDWVQFKAQAGHHYLLETGPNVAAPAVNFDTALWLYAADGTTELAHNDDMDHTGLTKLTSPTEFSRIVYQASEDATLYVQAAFYEGSGSEGHYALRVADTTDWWLASWAWGFDRASVTSTGTEIAGNSYWPDISADGRMVTFLSYESVVPAGSNAQQQVYVRDATSRTTSLVSAGVSGALGDNVSSDSVISGDGKHVAFSSYASNLIPADINGIISIFVRDLESGETTCVSVNPSGQPANGSSYGPSISRDGRYVAFWSYSSDLVPGGSGTYSQIYVRDLASGETTCASVTMGGALGGGHCWDPSISGDGRRVVFQSQANDLVAGDTNVKDDLFVRYLDGGTTTKISVTSTGAQFTRGSRDAVMSDDGAHVAFITGAALTPDDINGDVDIYVRHLDMLTAGSLGIQGVTTGPGLLLPITRVTDDTMVDYLAYEESGVRLSISGDGRYVTFQADNNDASRGDANSSEVDIHDIFMADTSTGTSRFVSMSAVPGVQADGDSYDAVVSDDGKYVAFSSYAENVVVGDENAAQDIFRAKVDVAPPVTASDGKPSYSGQALITLTPTDFSGAGIRGTWFSLDGSSEITYTAPITVAGVGPHVIRFFSVDMLGNRETMNTLAFTIGSGASIVRPWSPYSVRAGRSFEVYGWIKPLHANGPKFAALKFYRLQKGKWVLKKTFWASAYNRSYWPSTKYAARLRIFQRGYYKIVATHTAGDRSTLVSPVRFMWVR